MSDTLPILLEDSSGAVLLEDTGALLHETLTAPVVTRDFNQGNWWGLIITYEINLENSLTPQPLVCCPNDGHRLRKDRWGDLHCPHDGWRPPDQRSRRITLQKDVEQFEDELTVCPNDGAALQLGVDGILHCVHDGWTSQAKLPRYRSEQDPIFLEAKEIVCPNDGTVLEHAQDGTLFCPHEGLRLGPRTRTFSPLTRETLVIPTTCPNDGTLLHEYPDGTLRCEWDGWIWRGQAPAD